MSEQLLRKICVLPDQVDINGQHQLRKAVSKADVGLGFQMKSYVAQPALCSSCQIKQRLLIRCWSRRSINESMRSVRQPTGF